MPLASQKRVEGVSRFGRLVGFGASFRADSVGFGASFRADSVGFGRFRSVSVAKTRLPFGVLSRFGRVGASGDAGRQDTKKARFHKTGNRATSIARCRAFLCFD